MLKTKKLIEVIQPNEEDAKEFVEEYIDGVVAILLGAGELKED